MRCPWELQQPGSQPGGAAVFTLPWVFFWVPVRIRGEYPRLGYLSHFTANLLCDLASPFTSLSLHCFVLGLEEQPSPRFPHDMAARLLGRE